jgi:hypothetical protein
MLPGNWKPSKKLFKELILRARSARKINSLNNVSLQGRRARQKAESNKSLAHKEV